MDETLTGGYQRPDPLSRGFGKPPQPNSILSQFDNPQETTGQHNAILRALMGLEEGAFDFFQNPGTGNLGSTLGTALSRGSQGLREMITQAVVNFNGRRYQGATHAEAIDQAARALGRSSDDIERTLTGNDYSFMTSLGRLVGRDEGTQLATASGQLGRRVPGPLMSEELTLPRTGGQGPGGTYIPSRPDPFSEFERLDADERGMQEAIARLLAAGQ